MARGISLPRIPWKVFTKLMKKRVKHYVERPHGEEQAGFRSGISTIDKLLTMRQMLKKGIEHNQKVFRELHRLQTSFRHHLARWNMEDYTKRMNTSSNG